MGININTFQVSNLQNNLLIAHQRPLFHGSDIYISIHYMMKIRSIYCFICYTYYVRKFIFVSFALIYEVTSKFSAELPIPMSGGWRDPHSTNNLHPHFLKHLIVAGCGGQGVARPVMHCMAPHHTTLHGSGITGDTLHWWADHQVISAFWSNNY